jgi:phosphoribosylanthranilate isomerase
VKICGLTRPDDARAAVHLGARYLGVIFAGGPRQIDEARADAIVKEAGEVPVIGVFGSQGSDEILGIRDRVGLAGAQLHGGATPEIVRHLAREGLLVLAVARLAGSSDLDRVRALQALDCPLLVEPRVEGRLGGSGVALPLDLARQARACLANHPMFLAGGLTPDNVADAVRAVGPDAVDVSSGVEQIPGVKDHRRMARFLEVLGWV